MQCNEIFPESSGDARGSAENSQCNELTKPTLKNSGDKKSNALQSDDEESCFSAKSAESSNEYKFTVTDDVVKGEKKQKLCLSSSSQKRKLPLQTVNQNSKRKE